MKKRLQRFMKTSMCFLLIGILMLTNSQFVSATPSLYKYYMQYVDGTAEDVEFKPSGSGAETISYQQKMSEAGYTGWIRTVKPKDVDIYYSGITRSVVLTPTRYSILLNRAYEKYPDDTHKQEYFVGLPARMINSKGYLWDADTGAAVGGTGTTKERAAVLGITHKDLAEDGAKVEAVYRKACYYKGKWYDVVFRLLDIWPCTESDYAGQKNTPGYINLSTGEVVGDGNNWMYKSSDEGEVAMFMFSNTAPGIICAMNRSTKVRTMFIESSKEYDSEEDYDNAANMDTNVKALVSFWEVDNNQGIANSAGSNNFLTSWSRYDESKVGFLEYETSSGAANTVAFDISGSNSGVKDKESAFMTVATGPYNAYYMVGQGAMYARSEALERSELNAPEKYIVTKSGSQVTNHTLSNAGETYTYRIIQSTPAEMYDADKATRYTFTDELQKGQSVNGGAAAIKIYNGDDEDITSKFTVSVNGQTVTATTTNVDVIYGDVIRIDIPTKLNSDAPSVISGASIKLNNTATVSRVYQGQTETKNSNTTTITMDSTGLDMLHPTPIKQVKVASGTAYAVSGTTKTIDETFTYKITQKVPAQYGMKDKSLVITDKFAKTSGVTVSGIKMSIDGKAQTALDANYFSLTKNSDGEIKLTANVANAALYNHTYDFYITCSLDKANAGVWPTTETGNIQIDNTVTTAVTLPSGTSGAASAKAVVYLPVKVNGTLNLQKYGYQKNEDGTKTEKQPLHDATFKLQYLALDGTWKDTGKVYVTNEAGQIKDADRAFDIPWSMGKDCKVTDGKYTLRVAEIKSSLSGEGNPSAQYESAEVNGEIVEIDYENLNVVREFTVDKFGGEGQTIDLTTDPINNVHVEVDGFVIVEKVETETGQQFPISGATFELLVYSAAEDAWKHVDYLVESTSEPGTYGMPKEITVENYPDVYVEQDVTNGLMKVCEVTAPDGYYNDGWEQTFSLSDFNNVADETLRYTIENGKGVSEQYKKASLKIVKTDKKDNTKKVAGAVYEVRAAEDISIEQVYVKQQGDYPLVKKGDVIATVTTDADGTAVIENLYPGKYEVQETVSPDTYLLDETVHIVDVKASEENVLQHVVEFAVKDEAIEATPVIAKKTARTEGVTLVNGRYEGTKKPGPYSAGEAIKYDITVTNNGNVPLRDLVVVDSVDNALAEVLEHGKAIFVLPSSLKVTSALGNEVSVAYTDDTKTSIMISALLPGDSVQLTATDFIKEDKSMIFGLVNTVEITDGYYTHNEKNFDIPVTEEMKDTAVVDIPGIPELKPEKTSDKQEFEVVVNDETGEETKVTTSYGAYKPGETITYTIDITNTGECDLTEVYVEDVPSEELFAITDSIKIVYPEEMVYLSKNKETITITKENDLFLILDQLKSGDSVTVTVEAKLKDSEEILGNVRVLNTVNTSGIYYDGLRMPTAPGDVPINVPGDVDIRIAKKADRTSGVELVDGRYEGERVDGEYRSGDDISFLFTVTNLGTADGIDIVLTEILSQQQMDVLSRDSLVWDVPENGVLTSANGKEVRATVLEAKEVVSSESTTDYQMQIALDRLNKMDSVEVVLKGKLKEDFQSATSAKNIVTLTGNIDSGDPGEPEPIPQTPETEDEEEISAEGKQPILLVAKKADRTSGVKLVDGSYGNEKRKNGKYKQGEKIDYVFTVTNAGDADMTNVVLTDCLSNELCEKIKLKKSGFVIPSNYTFKTAFGKTCIIKETTEEGYFGDVESYYGKDFSTRKAVVIDKLDAGDAVEIHFTAVVASSAETGVDVPNVAAVYGTYYNGTENVVTEVTANNMDEELVDVFGDNNVDVEKSAQDEVAHPSSELTYMIDKIRNNTQETLKNFTVTDKLPKGTALKELHTGVYNDDITISVYYKTNLSKDMKIWDDNVHSTSSEKLSTKELNLKDNEYVTEFSICYGEVEPGFKETEKPVYTIYVGNTLKKGDKITNTIEVSAYLKGKRVKDKEKVKTPVGDPAPGDGGGNGNGNGNGDGGGNSYGYGPQTGDATSFLLYILVAVVAAGGILAILISSKKKKGVEKKDID